MPPKAPTKTATKPALWSSLKKKARASKVGGEPGTWTPTKAAMARREYEKRGGKFAEKGGR